MSNSLTGINQAYWSKQQTNINQIKSKINENTKNNSNESFEKMLNTSLSNQPAANKNQPHTYNNKINQNKLTKKGKKLYNTCVEMESLLWKQVLSTMKKTINKYKLIDGGQGEEFFTDFLYDEYAMMLAKNSSSNIAGNIFMQLSGHIT